MTNRSNRRTISKPESQPGRLIGYARVSTKEQSLTMQIEMLMAAGVDEANIFSEKVSALAVKRPQLAEACRKALKGDTFVVYKLDRLGRDLPDLIKRLQEFLDTGVKFKSLTEGISIDLGSCRPAERLQVNMIASLAQFEVDLDRERTSHGIRAAQARGVQMGAKEKISDEQVKEAITLRDKGASQAQLAKRYGVSSGTIHRRIKKYENQ